MFDIIVAVPDGTYRFAPEGVFLALQRRWPASTFAPAAGLVAESSTGQVRVREADGQHSVALVEVLVGGNVVTIEVSSDEIAAEVVSLITSLRDFPDDGSVVLFEWGPPEIPLRPSLGADDLIAAHQQ